MSTAAAGTAVAVRTGDQACAPDREERPDELDYVAYGRIRVWLGQADLVARQVEFYEKPPQRGFFARLFGRASASGDQPVRRFRQQDMRYVGPIPVAHRIEVESPAERSRTLIDVVDVSFNKGLTDAFFGPASLTRRSR
jgi:hypothetical protein